MQKPAKRTRHRKARVAGIVLAILLVIAWLVLGGVGQHQVRGYGPLVHALDGKSELHISTYAAWYPRQEVAIPFVYKRRVSGDSLFFQVFIREAGRTAGRNPHVESIQIHSFAYRFGTNPRTELIRDYAGNFWMQGSPEYNTTSPDLPAVLYFEKTPVTVEIDLTLNGQAYTVEGEMDAYEHTTFYPLVFDLLR